MNLLTIIITIVIGLLLGVSLSMIIYTREWERLDSKISKLREEKQELYNTVERLQLEKFISGVTFEED